MKVQRQFPGTVSTSKKTDIKIGQGLVKEPHFFCRVLIIGELLLSNFSRIQLITMNANMLILFHCTFVIIEQA